MSTNYSIMPGLTQLAHCDRPLIVQNNKATSAASRDSTPPDNLTQDDISGQENLATATINVSAVQVPELTEQEQSDNQSKQRFDVISY